MNCTEQRLGAAPYVLAGLSFIPLIGVPFGLAAFIWGLMTKKTGGRLLSLIGAGGVVSTVLIYSGLYYKGFVERGGIYDELRGKLSQRLLNELVPVIEVYRLQHGTYPASLRQLEEAAGKNGMFL